MERRTLSNSLPHLDADKTHSFQEPQKKINDHADVSFFLSSTAYRDIVSFMLQLNAAMFPRKPQEAESGDKSIQIWTLDDPEIVLSEEAKSQTRLLEKLGHIIEEAPPDPGPRRFGNISFRKWYSLVESRIDDLLEGSFRNSHVPANSSYIVDARKEFRAYLLGSFGSAQRLDYGTGHELSFLAYLGGLWKIGYFRAQGDCAQERSIVFGAVAT